MDRDTAWSYIEAERLGLADLLASLSGRDWEQLSLCPGWRVRDVAAHIISSPQARLLPTLGGFVRYRGDFDRMILAQGRRWGRAAPGDIVAQFRRYAGSRKHPPGTTYWEPLLDALVHGQDIAVPLGRTRPMPPEAAAAAATRVWAKAFPFKARKRLAGLRFEATDTDWSAGDGLLVRGPVDALLVTLTGRPHAIPRLSGEGAENLTRRFDPTVSAGREP